jgi:hypothetical protein
MKEYARLITKHFYIIVAFRLIYSETILLIRNEQDDIAVKFCTCISETLVGTLAGTRTLHCGNFRDFYQSLCSNSGTSLLLAQTASFYIPSPFNPLWADVFIVS